MYTSYFGNLLLFLWIYWIYSDRTLAKYSLSRARIFYAKSLRRDCKVLIFIPQVRTSRTHSHNKTELHASKTCVCVFGICIYLQIRARAIYLIQWSRPQTARSQKLVFVRRKQERNSTPQRQFVFKWRAVTSRTYNMRSKTERKSFFCIFAEPQSFFDERCAAHVSIYVYNKYYNNIQQTMMVRRRSRTFNLHYLNLVIKNIEYHRACFDDTRHSLAMA